LRGAEPYFWRFNLAHRQLCKARKNYPAKLCAAGGFTGGISARCEFGAARGFAARVGFGARGGCVAGAAARRAGAVLRAHFAA
jgi:hypothetical protein